MLLPVGILNPAMFAKRIERLGWKVKQRCKVLQLHDIYIQAKGLWTGEPKGSFLMTKVTFHSRVFAKLKHLVSEHFAGLAGIIASAGDEKKQLFLLRISQTDAEFTADYNTLSLCSFYQRGHEIFETTYYYVGQGIARIQYTVVELILLNQLKSRNWNIPNLLGKKN